MGKLTRDKIKGKKALTKAVILPASDEDAELLEQARRAVGMANIAGDNARAVQAKAKLRETEEQVGERGVVFTFRGIGRPAFEALRRAHPPTEAQKAEAGPNNQLSFNVDTFPAALCFASAVDSDLTEAEWVADIFESSEFNSGELAMLFNAAQDANTDSKVVELGNS